VGVVEKDFICDQGEVVLAAELVKLLSFGIADE
jgi:hypothetical protein